MTLSYWLLPITIIHRYIMCLYIRIRVNFLEVYTIWKNSYECFPWGWLNFIFGKEKRLLSLCLLLTNFSMKDNSLIDKNCCCRWKEVVNVSWRRMYISLFCNSQPLKLIHLCFVKFWLGWLLSRYQRNWNSISSATVYRSSICSIGVDPTYMFHKWRVIFCWICFSYYIIDSEESGQTTTA